MSKYRQEILEMSGVDIMIDDNTFKDVYDIFQELSQVWDNLKQTQQARISEILGGTRGLTVISSIMQNFGDAEAALADAMDAAGLAMKSNETIMDTTDKKIQQLKTSFEVLSHDVLEADLTKSIVDFGTKAIDLIDSLVNKIGALPVALGALTGLDVIKNLGNIPDLIKLFSKGASSQDLSGLAKSIASIGEAANISATSVLQFGAAIAIPIAAAGAFAIAYSNMQKAMRENADNASASVKDMSSGIEEQISRISELKGILDDENTSIGEAATIRGELRDIQSALIDGYGLEANAIDLLGDSVEVTNEKLQKVLGQESRKAIDQNREAYEEAFDAIENGNDKILKMRSVLESLTNLGNYGDGFSTFFDDMVAKFDNVSYAADGVSLSIKGNAYEVQDALNGIYDAALAMDTSQLTDSQKRVWNRFVSDIRSGVSEVGSVIEEFGNRYQDYLLNQILADDDSRHIMNRVSDYVQDLNDAIANSDWSGARDAMQKLLTLEGLDLRNGQFSDEVKNYIAQIINDALSDLPNEMNPDFRGEDWWMRYYGNGMEQGAEQTAQSIKQSFDSLFTDSEGKETDFSKAIDKYISDVTDLQEALAKLESGTLSDSDMYKLFKDFPQLAAGSDDLKSAIEALLDSMDSDIAAEFDKQLENLSEQDQTKLLAMEDAILGIGNAANSSAQQLSSLKEGLDLLQTAMVESASGTGLTTESVNALIARYGDLAGFDMASLFERTANGIHLNKNALDDLERAYIGSEQSKIASDLEKEIQAYADLSEQISMCSDASERMNLFSERDSVLDRINDLKMLQAEYEGLTSAYNRWQFAQSAGSESDTYKTIAGAWEGYKEQIDAGWIDNETRAFIDLISAEDLATAGADKLKEAWDSFHKNIEGSGGYSITDFFIWDDDKNLTTKGLENFVKATYNKLGETFAKYDSETDRWNIDFSGDKIQQVADAFGLSTEAIEIFLKALADAGKFDISFDTLLENSDLAESALEKVADDIKSLREKGGYEPLDIKFNVSSVEEAETSLNNAKTHLTELREFIAQHPDDWYLYVNDSDIQEAETAVIILAQSLAELQNQEFELNFDTSNITEEGQEFLDTISALNSDVSELEVRAQFNLDDNGLEEQVNSEIDTITSMLSSAGIDVDIDVNATASEKLQTLMDTLSGMTDEQRQLFVDTFGLDEVKDVKETEDSLEDKKITVTANTAKAYSNLSSIVRVLGSINSKSVTITTYHNDIYSSSNSSSGSVSKPGSGSSSGNTRLAQVTGTAHARGNWGTSKTERALVGELGPEIVVDPSNGTWHTVGDNGPEITTIQQGSIIFNHNQTEDLLEHGQTDSRGEAFASGTAYAGTATGGFTSRSSSGSNNYTINTKSSSSSSSSSSAKNYSSSGSSSSSSTAEKDSNEAPWEEELKRYQHMRKMEQMSDEEYYDHLMDLLDRYYSVREQYLDDYWSLEEEHYDLGKDLADDWFNDMQHQIDLLSHHEGTEDQQIEMYREMQEKASRLADEYRARGIDDNDELIQNLQKQWWQYQDNIDGINDDIDKKNKERSDDWFNDMQHQIDLLSHHEGTTRDQIAMYMEMQEKAHSLAEEARAQGLDDNDEYIQNLQDQWEQTTTYIHNEYSKPIELLGPPKVYITTT